MRCRSKSNAHKKKVNQQDEMQAEMQADVELALHQCELTWKNHTDDVMKELISSKKFLWEHPSRRLIQLCTLDDGCIQHGHHELADMMDEEKRKYLTFCVDTKCADCQVHGFPCVTLAFYGFANMNMFELWFANFD